MELAGSIISTRFGIAKDCAYQNQSPVDMSAQIGQSIVTALVLCLLYCHKCLWGVVVYSGCHCRDSPIVLGVFMVSLPIAIMAISPILMDGGIIVAETIHNIHTLNQ